MFSGLNAEIMQKWDGGWRWDGKQINANNNTNKKKHRVISFKCFCLAPVILMARAFFRSIIQKTTTFAFFFFFFCVVASSRCGRSLESVLNVVVVLSLLFSYACVLLDVAYPIHAMSQRKKNNAKKGKLRGGWGAHHRRKFFLFGLGPIVHRAFLCNFLFRSYLGLWMVVFLFVLFLILLLWTKKEREREKDARNQDPSLFAINSRVVAWNKCTFWQGSSNDVGLH